VDAAFIDLFRPVAKAVTEDLERMKLDGEISYETPHAREVDRLNIPEWFEKRSLSGLATNILRAAYVGEYGLEIDQQSALNLLLTMGDETPSDEVRVFGPSDERFTSSKERQCSDATGGTAEEPVEFGTRLEAIASNGSGFRLALRRDNTAAEANADILVLALPFTILRQLDVRVKLPEAKRKAIHELGYGTNAKLIAGFFPPRLGGGAQHRLHFHRLGIPMLLGNQPRASPAPTRFLTNFAGGNLGRHLDDGELQDRAATFASQVERIIRGRSMRSRRRAGAPALAQLALCPRPPILVLKPGPIYDARKFRGAAGRKPVFRGRNTPATDFNGYMEGAAESGERGRQRSVGEGRAAEGEPVAASLCEAWERTSLFVEFVERPTGPRLQVVPKINGTGQRPSLQRSAVCKPPLLDASSTSRRVSVSILGAALRGFVFSQHRYAQSQISRSISLNFVSEIQWEPPASFSCERRFRERVNLRRRKFTQRRMHFVD